MSADLDPGELRFRAAMRDLAHRGALATKRRATVALDALRSLRAAQAAEKLAAGTSYADRRLVFSNPLGEPVDPTP